MTRADNFFKMDDPEWMARTAAWSIEYKLELLGCLEGSMYSRSKLKKLTDDFILERTLRALSSLTTNSKPISIETAVKHFKLGLFGSPGPER